jgi:two-component system, NarL family, nitrate/nitrite response regulator NarL
MPVKIVVADDHEIVRQGIRSLLETRPEWNVCGEASDGEATMEVVRKTSPDAVVMDVTMPGQSGLEVTKWISKFDPNIKVLIFTMHDSRTLVKAAQQAGARGVVLKSFAARDLIRALESILDGGTFFESPDSKSSKKSGFGGLFLVLRADRLVPA